MCRWLDNDHLYRYQKHGQWKPSVHYLCRYDLTVQHFFALFLWHGVQVGANQTMKLLIPTQVEIWKDQYWSLLIEQCWSYIHWLVHHIHKVIQPSIRLSRISIHISNQGSFWRGMLNCNPHTFHPLILEIGSPLNAMCYAFVDIIIAPSQFVHGVQHRAEKSCNWELTDSDSSPTQELRRVSLSPRRWMYGDFVSNIQTSCTLLKRW